MTQPMILDLLGGGLSPEEVEHAGPVLVAYNVEITTIGGETVVHPVLAPDSVEAIDRAFDLMFPDWSVNRPTSGMKIKVIAFDRRK